MRIKHFAWILLIIIVTIKLDGFVLAANSSLTDKEMAIPLGRYQDAVNMERTRQVSFKAPRTKPEIEWVKENDYSNMRRSVDFPVILDSEGGAWFVTGFCGWQNAINRLNPDGTRDWQKILPLRVLLVTPVVVLNNAVICHEVRVKHESDKYNDYLENIILDWNVLDPESDVYDERVEELMGDRDTSKTESLARERIVVYLLELYHEVPGSKSEFDDIERKEIEDFLNTLTPTPINADSTKWHTCLECFDLNGKTVWRTEIVSSNSINFSAWRISDNRIILPIDFPASGYFNIYSLSDGKLLESLFLPDYNFGGYDFGPLELKGGSWLGYRSSGDDDDTQLVRYNQDSSICWESENLTGWLNTPPLLSPDGILLIGGTNYLKAIDVESGESMWEHSNSGKIFVPCGINPEGNFLVRIGRGEPGFKLIESGGNEVWSLPHQGIGYILHNADIIIYEGGEILYGHVSGLTLVDVDGSIIWNIGSTDFGLTENDKSLSWFLNPVDEGQIIVSFSSRSTDTNFIFSLVQPKQQM